MWLKKGIIFLLVALQKIKPQKKKHKLFHCWTRSSCIVEQYFEFLSAVLDVGFMHIFSFALYFHCRPYTEIFHTALHEFTLIHPLGLICNSIHDTVCQLISLAAVSSIFTALISSLVAKFKPPNSQIKHTFFFFCLSFTGQVHMTLFSNIQQDVGMVIRLEKKTQRIGLGGRIIGEQRWELSEPFLHECTPEDVSGHLTSSSPARPWPRRTNGAWHRGGCASRLSQSGDVRGRMKCV